MIEVQQLIKRFRGVPAVDGISFRVEAGETFGLLGPNGAGKTTTMRILSGLSPADAGQVRLAGFDALTEGPSMRRVLGVVTQHDGLDDDLNVEQNLQVFGFLAGLSRRAARVRSREVLEFFGLESRARAAVHELSGGMKRRLAIARAWMCKPRVIILDEPTTGLDPHSRNRVWEELALLESTGVTILMSTHYMDEAATLCDRIAILDRGKILDLAPPHELIERHTSGQVAEIRSVGAEREKLRAALERSGFSWREIGAVFRPSDPRALDGLRDLEGVRIELRPANLEDVFLNLTGRELRDE